MYTFQNIYGHITITIICVILRIDFSFIGFSSFMENEIKIKTKQTDQFSKLIFNQDNLINFGIDEFFYFLEQFRFLDSIEYEPPYI